MDNEITEVLHRQDPHVHSGPDHWTINSLHVEIHSAIFRFSGTAFHFFAHWQQNVFSPHYIDVLMGAIESQIPSLTIVYSTVYSGADQRRHESSASLAFVRKIHRGPVNSPQRWPVTRKMFPFDDVIMKPVVFDCTSFNPPHVSYGAGEGQNKSFK